MPRNGSGTYSLPSGNPVSAGQDISPTWANNTLDDIGAALTASIVSDGQKAMAADLDMGSNKITSLDDGTSSDDAATYGQIPHRNLIINGHFFINQRGYTDGSSLASGDYAHDRWVATTAGTAYTTSSTPPTVTITITAGTLTQVVRGNNMVGGTYTLSWEGTATAKIGSGSFGSSPQTATGLTRNTQVNITFSTGTVSKVKFEEGDTATRWELPDAGAEALTCYQYYWDSGSDAVTFFNGDVSNGGTYYGIGNFPTVMISVPSITLTKLSGYGFPSGSSPGAVHFTTKFSVLERRQCVADTISSYFSSSVIADAELTP
jgi:hypothetical protein